MILNKYKLNKNNNVYIADIETDGTGDAIYIYIENVKSNKCKEFYNVKDLFIFLFNELEKENIYIYFHNLSFDGLFIIKYLLKNNFVYHDNNNIKNNSFNSYIDVFNNIYNIKIRYKNKYIKIYDSKKILNYSVDELAQNTKYKKIKYNFNNNKKINSKLKLRCKNDVKIVKENIKNIILNYGVESTAASLSIKNFIKENIKNINFKKCYPEISDQDFKNIHNAMIGGLCYLNNYYKNKELKNVYVYDINSMYPSIMQNELLPYGDPIYYKNEYEEDFIHKKYIQHIKVDFKLKKDKIPFLIFSKNFDYYNGEPITSSDGMMWDLWLTDDDLKLFYDVYDIYEIYYIEGYKFKATNKIFNKYIKKYYKLKMSAKDNIEKNFYKILLNSLYGKFGNRKSFYKKQPILENNKIIFKLLKKEYKNEGIYLPVAVFVNSYGRKLLYNAINKNIDKFIYCDTDSIHIIGKAENIKIDNKKIGYYKLEAENVKAKYLKSKCYIYQNKKKIKKVISGANKESREKINFKNFKKGLIIKNKMLKQTKKGVIIREKNFKIL